MDLVFSVNVLLPLNWYMASIEFKNANMHIPIAESCQKFLRLTVRPGKEHFRLRFRALSFGLSSSPRMFTKVMAEALVFLWLSGISVIAYLDDLLLFAPSLEQLSRDLQFAGSILENLGWLLNLEKSNLAQRVTIFRLLVGFYTRERFSPTGKTSEGG